MRRNNLLLIGFILLKFILQYSLINPEYDLHRDEYLHLDLGDHVALGYISVPPFIAYISWIIIQLGNSFFWIKFFPALFGALTLITVWKTIELLKGGTFALILGAVAILFSTMVRMNMLYQPNSFDILSWTLLYFALINYFKSEQSKYLYVAAVVFALGFLNKYNIAFLAAGLAPALLIGNRSIFSNRHLYFAGFFALVLISPNLIWQYANNFPVVHHMQELAETQLVNVKTSDFIKEQILFFLGSVFVVIVGLLAPFKFVSYKKYRFVPISFLITILLFIYFRAKGYYAVGLYPILIAFGAVSLEKLLDHGRQKYLRPVLIAIPIILFVSTIKLLMPVESPERIQQNAKAYKSIGVLRWEDGKDHALPQDFADMLAWREMARIVDSAYALVPDKQHTLILCDNYGQTGAVNYYSRFPELRAVSFNADYINWFPLDETIENVIAVKELDDDDPGRTRETPIFESVKLLGTVENKLAREYGTKIFIYVGAKADINKRIADEIAESKWK